MRNFKQDGKAVKRTSKSSDFGDSGRFARVDSRITSFDKQMHRATCGKCGSICEVPFKPSERKPVYCKSCFVKDNNSSDSRRSEPFKRDIRRESPRASFSVKEERPASGKQDQYVKEFEQINRKLDKILEALEND